MNLLNPYEVAVLQAARRVLFDLEPAAVSAAREPGAATQAVSLGRLAEAASVADDGVFNVLNTCSSYLNDDAAQAALRFHGTPERAATITELRAALEQLPDEAVSA